jgi:hypothetical protein
MMDESRSQRADTEFRIQKDKAETTSTDSAFFSSGP